MTSPLTWAPFDGGPWGVGAVLCRDGVVGAVWLPAEAEVASRIVLGFPEAVAAAAGSATRVIAGEIARRFHGGDPYDDIAFAWPEGMTPFTQRVSEACRAIPIGHTATYAELASAAGSPGAVRAAGQVMARNPLPLLVPCHRVVPATGGVGNFGGGAALKAWLLARESRHR